MQHLPAVRGRPLEAAILDAFGRPLRPVRVTMMPPAARGTYDAARSSNQTKTAWEQASGRSADAEASPQIRAVLRNRARYETRNNSYVRGIINTKAADVVGRVPHLQIDTGDPLYDRFKEEAFKEWAEEIKLGQKLRLSENHKIESGEVFLIFFHNPKLRGPVKLDMALVEPDRCVAQMDKLRRKHYRDGIEYDEDGNPTSYDILNAHPGGTSILSGLVSFTMPGRYTPYPADQVIHRFRRTRPSQSRGVTELVTALPLFTQLRRYTLAVLTAAETAAALSWLLESQSDSQLSPININAMDEISFELGSGMTLPAGWTMKQMKAEHPSTTYKEFKREILNEVARCVSMPLNIALGNSAGYNYASGRLDHQSYFKQIVVEQYDLGLEVTRIYRRWSDLYQFTPGARLSPLWFPGYVDPHQWHFDGTEHVDPLKEAAAQEKRLKNLTTSLATEYAKQGKAWEREVRQIAKERAVLRELKISLAEAAPPTASEARELEDDEDAIDQDE